MLFAYYNATKVCHCLSVCPSIPDKNRLRNKTGKGSTISGSGWGCRWGWFGGVMGRNTDNLLFILNAEAYIASFCIYCDRPELFLWITLDWSGRKLTKSGRTLSRKVWAPSVQRGQETQEKKLNFLLVMQRLRISTSQRLICLIPWKRNWEIFPMWTVERFSSKTDSLRRFIMGVVLSTCLMTKW